jgi:hypothetical protein
MSNNSIPQKKPHKPKIVTPNHDPGRRLLAAIVVQSVIDCFYPERQTPKHARLSAAAFLQSDDGHAWLSEFGISTWKINRKLGRLS